jgi:hypothetical protein
VYPKKELTQQTELSCVVEHINTNHNTELSDRDANFLDLGATKAHRQRLGPYIEQLLTIDTDSK